MALTSGQQIKAKNRGVFVYDFTSAYVRVGKWNTDMSKSLNPETKDETNVWGEPTFSVDALKPSIDVNPYKVYEGDDLADYIHDGIVAQKTGDYWEGSVIDVVVDDDGAVVEAKEYPAVIEVTSEGWDSSNYWYEFSLHYTGAGSTVTGTITKSADGRKQTFTKSA